MYTMTTNSAYCLEVHACCSSGDKCRRMRWPCVSVIACIKKKSNLCSWWPVPIPSQTDASNIALVDGKPWSEKKKKKTPRSTSQSPLLRFNLLIKKNPHKRQYNCTCHGQEPRNISQKTHSFWPRQFLQFSLVMTASLAKVSSIGTSVCISCS